MESNAQRRVVTYTDSRPAFSGLVVFAATAVASAVAASLLGVEWLVVGLAGGVIAALVVAKRMHSTTWRVSGGAGTLEVQFGNKCDVFSLTDVTAAGTWEMTDSLQELVLEFRDGKSVGVPLYAKELLLALGRELRLVNSTPKLTRAAQEVLGWGPEGV